MADPISTPIPQFDPPEGWLSAPPPTDPREEEILRAEFGEPDENGIYAPHVEG